MKSTLSVALAFLFLAVANGALLGNKRCTWGPTYWCQHLGTARECGSTRFCTQLWQRTAKQSVDANPTECAFCKLLIADLERKLVSQKTEAEIRAEAEKACMLVPQASVQSLCKSMVDAYLPEVLELIKQKLPPSKICAALSMCGSGARDPVLRTPVTPTRTPARTPVNDICADCEGVLQIVKQTLEKNGTAQEIEQLLKTRVCSQLGPLQEACDGIVDQYLPEVLVLLDNDIQPKQLCQLLGFCKAKLPKFHAHPVLQLMLLQKSQKKLFSSIECQVCEALVNDARQMIRDQKTEQEVLDFVKNRVCSLLPAQQAKCAAAVTQYGPIIFQLLASELDPATVCQALGACGKSVSGSRAPLKVVPAAAVHRLSSSAASAKPKLGPECILCEYVLHELDELLDENRTQEAVESALERVCSVLPSSLRTDCDNFVRRYTRVVMQLVANDVNPALVCTVISLCPGQKTPPLKRYVKTGVKSGVKTGVKSGVKSATTCDICQTIISYAKALLKENSTEEEITELIEKACQFLPAAEQPACKAFIGQYAPYVIQLLLQDVEPQKICQAMGLCSASKRASLRQTLLLHQPRVAARTHRQRTLRYRPNGMVHMGAEHGGR